MQIAQYGRHANRRVPAATVPDSAAAAAASNPLTSATRFLHNTRNTENPGNKLNMKTTNSAMEAVVEPLTLRPPLSCACSRLCTSVPPRSRASHKVRSWLSR